MHLPKVPVELAFGSNRINIGRVAAVSARAIILDHSSSISKEKQRSNFGTRDPIVGDYFLVKS